MVSFFIIAFPVGWDCRIHLTASLQTGKTPPRNECPKQSDGEVSVMLELWGLWSTPSLPLLPLWLGTVAPDNALSMS